MTLELRPLWCPAMTPSLSSTTTRAPGRACSAARAVLNPTMPPPTTTRSNFNIATLPHHDRVANEERAGKADRVASSGGSTVLEEARAFLTTQWSPTMPRRDWQALVVDGGWAALRWPTD